MLQGHRLSNLAIVEDIRLLNTIFALTFSFYIINTVLFYFQVWRPFKKTYHLKIK